MVSLSIFLFVVLFMLFLGGAVLIDDQHRRMNRLFFGWILFAVAWMIANYLENLSALSPPVREWLLRADFAISLLAFVMLVLFVIEFVGYRRNWKRDALIFLAPLALFALSFTPALVSGIYQNERDEIGYVEGWAYSLYRLTLIALFIGAMVLLLVRRRRTKPPLRNQITVVAIGLVMTLVITIPINFFFQNVVPVSLQRLGIYSFLFFVVATATAIVRHKFLQVRFFLAEMLFFGVLAVEISRIILSESVGQLFVNILIFAVLLVFGFGFLQSILKEIRQSEELQVLSRKLEHANQRLTSANRKLKELDALKTEFLSIASHQLRTPLAVTKGYLSMLSSGMVGRLSAKQRQAVGTLNRTNEGLIALVNQLLDLSRIESNRLTLNMVRMDLNASIVDVTDFLLARAHEKGLVLKVVPQRKDPPVFIQADVGKVHEILSNVLDNAIKYTEKGSITVRLHVSDGMATVEVKDTGYGLTAKDKLHLFEKFASGSASKKANVTSGFGLFVVRKLCKAMGGRVEGNSPGSNRGSTFHISFPLAKGAQ